MNTDKLHECYDAFKDKFETNFHTALWKIMFDNIHDGKVGCFVIGNVSSNGIRLGFAIANEPGYIPLPAYFNEDILYDQATAVLYDLNQMAFGFNNMACDQIIISSMRKAKTEETVNDEE